MTYVYSFSLYPETVVKEYNACYEWRKVVSRNELWSQLPQEIIEMVASECVVKRIVAQHQPSGSCNFSRIDNATFEIAQNQQNPQIENYFQQYEPYRNVQ